ncbi:MAG: DoxX family protein [Sorangiineae bacterium]|nr:DoxX family protein [Polyangiaceae bacterium]MEB2320900.1 DoxX family protein [Sorangiineae bacterium]
MLTRLLRPKSELFFTVLRVGAGLMFMCHGLQKLFGLLGGQSMAVGSKLWFGGIIELTTGLAMTFGFLTTYAALLAAAMMAVAYYTAHWKLAFGTGFFPIVNRGELAAVYLLLFLYIGARGAGPYSLDAKLARKPG